MKFTYTVTVDIIDDPALGPAMIADHIRESVRQWGGQYHPAHPLFSAYVKKVTCKRVKNTGPRLDSVTAS